ncbi:MULTISPECIES: hypothetical protein [Olivibacter]|jgi:hypothetical protein|uniref:Uncharacterized protein n=3 Tax=Sphingobacteriaceae TaxID=84566 RepID=F4C7E7_SPHS2|nr:MULTISPECIES: hypothetical protein [Olivibacter]MCL4641686.1 hypothetical protein [Olivibacter sp. UJ_SKK_5.1]MDM8175765.1 hypothetical protein [Olivibacter sp. 47]MDX3914373.1 hypothetical protein [Pseudosphingobacterium sp.]QEL02498.1 hypothetical protein FKG96_17310 [Olivibacter sp. LS-1]
MNQVLIFKTSVNAQKHVQQVAALFKSIKLIKQWSFDLDDCDRVLRVVSLNVRPEMIENLLRTEGIYCEHMEYEL